MTTLRFILLCLLAASICQARTHFYDDANRLILTVSSAGQAVRYTYDDADNLTKIESLGLPAAPSQLTVTRIDLTRATLTWQDNANNETGFQLMRRLSGDYKWQNVILLNPNEITYTDVSLDPKKNYVYRLVANAPGGDGLTSAYSNSTTAAGQGSESFDMSEPDLQGNRIEFSFETEMDELYIVESSTALEEASWSPTPFAKASNEPAELQSLTGNDARMSLYLDEPEGDRMFYRVTRQ